MHRLITEADESIMSSTCTRVRGQPWEPAVFLRPVSEPRPLLHNLLSASQHLTQLEREGAMAGPGFKREEGKKKKTVSRT